VQDNKVNQLVIQRLLSRVGCKTEIASNGEEAIHILQQKPKDFQLIIMDLEMPILGKFSITVFDLLFQTRFIYLYMI
jgi:CheY-like chemotaxis protein